MTPFTTALTYDGIPLDLSGKRDEEDCWIERVCVAGSQHDISEMLDDGVIGRLSELADAQLSREAAEQRADAAWTRYELERAYA